MTALIVAPYFRRPFHVGRIRVERFIRWLNDAGHDVILIRAGEKDGECSHPWGLEIVVADPLGLHPEQAGETDPRQRKEYPPWVLWGAGICFCPDPGVVWSRRVLRHPRVRSLVAKAGVVISSSPPESCHLTAMQLARSSRSRLLIDLRDGWLDEPLKPSLGRSGFQRWREGRLEKAVLTSADQVLVTSPEWQSLMLERFPALENRVEVVTNCYRPAAQTIISAAFPPAGKRLQLVHAGQFSGSKFNNRPELLLAPLWAGLEETGELADVKLLGRFTRADLETIAQWRVRFVAIGSDLQTLPPISVDLLADTLRAADGLLLLSATWASLPAKIYDYLPSGRAILAVTEPGSAVWRLGEGSQQMFSQPMGTREHGPTSAFLRACRLGGYETRAPEELSDTWGGQKFKGLLQRLAPSAGSSRRRSEIG